MMLGLQLLASTGLILGGAHYLTRAADVIAERTGLGHSFVGVVLLATATSLPEMGTGVSAIYLGAPDLAMGAAFGSNLFNLLILACLDLYWRQGALLRAASRTAAYVAGLGAVVISVAGLAVLLHHHTEWMANTRLSAASWIVLAVFFLTMYLVYHHGGQEIDETPQDTNPDMSLAQALGLYVVAAGTVIVGAVWLAYSGDGLVKSLGLQASFVGTQFLALCTSLPEVATSFAALRMGAVNLAVTNVLGSNLFNMGFVLWLNDAVYRTNVWHDIGLVHAWTALFGLVMTFVVLWGLLRKAPLAAEHGPRTGYSETVLLMLLYLIGSVVVYYAS